nr:hypothetical protein GCM10020063_016730 [Dactylosporangium thailandense]
MVSVPWRIALVLLAAAGLLTAAEPLDPPADSFPIMVDPPPPDPRTGVLVVCTGGCPRTLFDASAWDPRELLEARAAFVHELVRGPQNCDEEPVGPHGACAPTPGGIRRRLADEGYPDNEVHLAGGRMVYTVLAGDGCIKGRFDPATRSRGTRWVAPLIDGRACPA